MLELKQQNYQKKKFKTNRPKTRVLNDWERFKKKKKKNGKNFRFEFFINCWLGGHSCLFISTAELETKLCSRARLFVCFKFFFPIALKCFSSFIIPGIFLKKKWSIPLMKRGRIVIFVSRMIDEANVVK
jgi:hypothetical protein